MVYENQKFSLNGPLYLTTIDWGNDNHKRAVVASLVQGVYTLEHDRRHDRQGDNALAPPWWQFFNFRLVRTLIDSKDASIFGAVFEFIKYPHGQTAGMPQYVIAFRGTLLKPETWEEDVKLNFKLFLNGLEESNRFQKGLEAASQTTDYKSVWLAGHSQGSSLALAVGREMVKRFRACLETYLFNPPFISLPIDQIKSEKVKLGHRITSSLLTAGLTATAVAVAADAVRADPFAPLSAWVPHLFINRADPLCSKYAGHFEHREYMEAIGAGEIAESSIGSILSSREALHLLPCAHLTFNVTAAPRFEDAHGIRREWLTFKEAHGIDQWWRRGLEVECKHYQHT
ncbi:GDSL esterase/lipase-like protein [Salvia divinorum]|uniref:GDSL esterase/lipase-like protein n=1 Tax=Salvia divinorum TaxID=28513 RepID=A0ABD1ICE1_SALDI